MLLIKPTVQPEESMTERRWLEASDPAVMVDWLRDSGRLSERKARLFAVACCGCFAPLPADERSRWARALAVAERYADAGATEAELRRAHNALHAEVYMLREAESWWGQRVLEFMHRVMAGFDDHWVYDFPPTPFDLAVLAAASRKAASGVCVVVREAIRVPEGFSAEAAAAAAARAPAVRDLLRHHFGNPFRPTPLDPSLPVWNGGVIRQLAQAAYDYPGPPVTPCPQAQGVRTGPQRPRRPAPRSPEPCGEMDPVRLAILADALEEAGCADPELLGHLRGPGSHVRGCWAVDAVLGRN